jgi:hypothetical protein
VRKQYHFQPSAAGFDAWDVDRLIQLSSALPVRQVALDSFWQLDTVYWTEPFTVRTFADHVRLVQAVDPTHSIVLAGDGRVMDGMHRIVRALLEGEQTIAAVQFEVTPEPHYRDCQPDDLPYPDADSG